MIGLALAAVIATGGDGVPDETVARARAVLERMLAGVDAVKEVFRQLDPLVIVDFSRPEGTKVDMVDIFRRSEHVPAIVDQALELFQPGLKSIWLQFNVVHEEAARTARDAGLDVIMDRCPKVEMARLMREIGAVGIRSNVLSSRLTRKI